MTPSPAQQFTTTPEPGASHATNAERGAPGPGPAIELRNVWRSYPVRRGHDPLVALQGISLTIPAGQRVALLGPNGSGKSTLLRILATLDRPDARESTSVAILGVNTHWRGEVLRVRSRLGVVFQSPGLDALLSVEENLMAQASLYGLGGAAARSRIAWAAERLRLTDRLRDRVGTLSGGLERRVDLARALLHDPDLLLLDEPTTGLDPRAREEFLATIDAVADEHRGDGLAPMTVVMSTHLMEEAQRAQRVVLLHRGRIVADEQPDALRRRVGGVIVHCRPDVDRAAEAEDILQSAGLIVSGSSATGNAAPVVVARVPEDGAGLEGALVALVRAGIPFEVGPPTLSDVFLTLTGEGLHAGDPAAANGDAPARRHARRARR